MKSFIRDLVEYNIQCDELPSSFENYSDFCLNNHLRLGDKDLNVQQISKVTVIPKLSNFYNLKDKSPSFNNLQSKDDNYFYEFLLNWRIEYVDLSENLIFSCNGESILSSYINLSCSHDGPRQVVPNIFIDDVHVELLSPSTCLLNFTGMVLVED